MKNGNLDISSIGSQVTGALRKVRSYIGIIFFLFVAILYGYILWRINVYSGVQANQAQENANIAAQPHVDQSTAQKLLNLQSNSVSVQTLFNEARQNPFQE